MKNNSLKENYINELRNSLKSLPSDERKDILYDYEEHFQMGLEGDIDNKNINGTVGQGNNNITITTISGDINILK